MNNYFNKLLSQIKNFFNSLTILKKISLVITLISSLFFIFYLFKWASTTNYVPLMSNLNGEDVNRIMKVLRDKKISFKLDESGKVISIPKENFYELKLELSTLGLPHSSVVGYELFDKQSLGTTNFVQKLNHKRAQEGELMRTINTMMGVRRSRVHLALPQKSTFIEDQKKSTASVVVELEPGFVLSDKQVYGIANLVSRAIEGLEISDVVIMDSQGKVLSKNPTEPLALATVTQLEFQEKVQSDLEKKIETVLSRIVGEGHVVARVTADLDFSQINETQTIYDSDGSAIRSVQKNNDVMNGQRPGPYGIPGQTSNSPNNIASSSGDIKTETSKNNEITNFEVPQTIRRTVRSQGAIQRLSIAVVVDGKQVKTVDDQGKTVIKNENWPLEKIKEFERIVSSTVGFNEKRGDILDIKNIEFSKEDFEEAQKIIIQNENRDYLKNLILYSLAGLIVLLFFFIVVRPFINWMIENTVDSVDTYLPQTIEELEQIQRTTNLPKVEEIIPVMPETLDPTKVEGEMIKEKIISLVDSNPYKAAIILKDWLHGIDRKKNLDSQEDNSKKNLLAS